MFIFSNPRTRTRLTRPLSMASNAAHTAAEPVAQAFSSLTAGTCRNSGTARAAREALKSCFKKPPLKWPMNIPSISWGSSPALVKAAKAASRIMSSGSRFTNLPNWVCPQPVICGFTLNLGKKLSIDKLNTSSLLSLP